MYGAKGPSACFGGGSGREGETEGRGDDDEEEAAGLGSSEDVCFKLEDPKIMGIVK